MALNAFHLSLLRPHLTGARVLALGYPDVICSMLLARETLGILSDRYIDKASDKAREWHPSMDPDAPDGWSLLCAATGRYVNIIDIKQWRGGERIYDLNSDTNNVERLITHDDLFEKVDLVLDHGTLEHCMNIGQALMNAAGFVKPGGRIFHGSPLSMVNHGFYNICPTLYHDFYKGNGWEIESFHIVIESGKQKVISLPIEAMTERFTVTAESTFCVIARRPLDHTRPMEWQMQPKYKRKMINDD